MIFDFSGCGVSPGAQLGDGERHPGGRRHDGEADGQGVVTGGKCHEHKQWVTKTPCMDGEYKR